jgi:hypothetical protein
VEIYCLPGIVLGSCFYIENTKSHIQGSEVEFSVGVKTDSVHVKNDRNQNLIGIWGTITIFSPGVRPPRTMMKLRNFSVVVYFWKVIRCQWIGGMWKRKVLLSGD